MLSRHLLLVLGTLCVGGADGAAPPAAPPPPKVYDVQIRYRINAFPNERIAQYNEMMRYLKAVGFERDPEEEPAEDEPENPNATRMRGTIPSDRVHRLLLERHIRSLLLVPHGAKVPADKTQPVRVDLQLASGMSPDRQRLLADQTREVLAGLGFKEGVGYDDRGSTRLLGSVPAGQVETLLKGLRQLPAGARQPPPFRNVTAVRVMTALPGMPVPKPRPAPAAIPKGQEKLTPDLREVLADPKRAATPTRLEVILAATPGPLDRDWLTLLRRAVHGLVVEGRLGPLVTVYGPPNRLAVRLDSLQEVVAVRLPRTARRSWEPGPGAEKDLNFKPLLDSSGLARLHAMGQRGRGTRVAVVDSDFRGWEGLVGKQLPRDTRLVDLTRERNHNLQPDPFPGGGGLGAGARCALIVMQAAPEARLSLIRIDPAAPYVLEAAARAINGEGYRSLSLDDRATELEEERVQLAERQDRLEEERRQNADEFSPDEEAVKRREDYRKRLAEFERARRDHSERLARFLRFQQGLRDLRGIRVVASGLVWNEGYPADGSSALSRYFDDQPFRAALWFQAAGDTRGQAWAGLFRDADRNGVMEFAAPGQPLAPGAWTRELDFLAWRPRGGRPVQDIPAKTRLRISLQWREAHDGLYLRVGEDPYRRPLTSLRLVVLYQPDPSGSKQPADDLEVVAQSVGLPERLEQTLSAATYEQTVELRVPRAGRYALRVEGSVPDSTRPPGEATLPALRKAGEVHPRVFVETLEGPGRAVLQGYATAMGSLGMPADAHRVITVGAADARGKAEPYSGAGPPVNMALLVKPDVLAYDRGEGTGAAACFAAGLAAAAWGRGVSPACGYLQALGLRPGDLLRIPAGWPRH